jgi:hypothetical protein
VRRLLGSALLSSAAMLAGCEYGATLIGPLTPDAAARPPTEDEQLADLGHQLAGTWRGSATYIGGFLSPEAAYFELTWIPDAPGSRAGELIVCAVLPEALCESGELYFSYSLNELLEPNSARGGLELVKPEPPNVGGYPELWVILQNDGGLFVDVKGGFFGLNGTFTRLTPPPGADAGPDASFR